MIEPTCNCRVCAEEIQRLRERRAELATKLNDIRVMLEQFLDNEVPADIGDGVELLGQLWLMSCRQVELLTNERDEALRHLNPPRKI